MPSAWMLDGWTPTLLLGGALWLGRNWIKERLAQGIKHEYDIKVANLQSDLKQVELRFEAQLREREGEIRALREGALSQVAQRHIALDRRRIEAAERIWAAAMSFMVAKATISVISLVKFENSLTESAKNPQFRKIFEICISKDEFSQLGRGSDNERPFVSDLAWALYQAYRAIFAYAALKGNMLKQGLNFPDLIDSAPLIKVVTEALPERASYIIQHGEPAIYKLLDELELKLLNELRVYVVDPDNSGQHVQQANSILKATAKVLGEEEPKDIPQEFVATPPSAN